MKFLSVEEYYQLPACPCCSRVTPTMALDANGGYCGNCAIANGKVYCQSKSYDLPQGLAIVCIVCGTQDPKITKYGEEYQVFCDNCSPLNVEEE